ncbi:MULTISPECIES: condensation domain-containing protein [Nonomuraea]|uniref:Condensation domain-containing protein n=1 Tax=Nonomuraea mangrovi TaxID=2316207 RepID=A0ABW4SY28_9ACTN
MSQVSFTQHGMWITELTGAGTVYHLPIPIRLNGGADRDALAKACRGVVDRHPLLGCALEDRDGVLHLVPAACPPALRVGEGGEEAVRAEVVRPFDLERGPLIRFSLLGDTLLVVAHHVVFDGRSKDVLVADLTALLEGESLPVPGVDAAARHTDVAAEQRERVESLLEEAGAFWTPRWREPGEIVVRGGGLRSRRASAGAVVEFPCEVPDLPGLTRFEVLVAAVHALLRSYGNAGVVTALDLSTRTPAEEDRVGCHVNELPLFTGPSPDALFADFAAEVRAELRRLYRFREVPLARAVPGIKPHAALAPVSISYRRVGEKPRLGEVEWLAFNHGVRGALQLQLADGPSGVEASLRYDPEEPVDAPGFAADLRAVLDAVADDPGRPLSRLIAPALTDAPATPSVSIAVSGASTPSAHSDQHDGGTGDALAVQIREIWEEVLQISPIEQDDDIFDLGGHSLTITQIIARMRKRLGVEVPLDDFFDNPTIAGVVAVIRR